MPSKGNRGTRGDLNVEGTLNGLREVGTERGGLLEQKYVEGYAHTYKYTKQKHKKTNKTNALQNLQRQVAQEHHTTENTQDPVWSRFLKVDSKPNDAKPEHGQDPHNFGLNEACQGLYASTSSKLWRQAKKNKKQNQSNKTHGAPRPGAARTFLSSCLIAMP